MKIQDTFSDMSRNISNQTTQFAHYSLVRLNLKYMELPFHYGGRFNSLFRNSKLTRKFLMGFCVNNRNIVFWRKQFRETKIGLFWKKIRKFEDFQIEFLCVPTCGEYCAEKTDNTNINNSSNMWPYEKSIGTWPYYLFAPNQGLLQ